MPNRIDKPDAVSCEQCRKGIVGKKGMLGFAQRGEGIEPFQLVIDEAGVTHDEPVIRQSLEKARKPRGKVLSCIEVVGAGESRIAADSERGGALSQSDAQDVQQQRLAVGELVRRRLGTPALAHPCGRDLLPHHLAARRRRFAGTDVRADGRR